MQVFSLVDDAHAAGAEDLEHPVGSEPADFVRCLGRREEVVQFRADGTQVVWAKHSFSVGLTHQGQEVGVGGVGRRGQSGQVGNRAGSRSSAGGSGRDDQGMPALGTAGPFAGQLVCGLDALAAIGAGELNHILPLLAKW